MNMRRSGSAILLVILALVNVTAAFAKPEFAANAGIPRRPREESRLQQLLRNTRRETSLFRKLSKAEEKGYAALLHCLSDPELGGMGYHYVNGDLVGDSRLNPYRPEGLVYEKLPNGEMKLVALEYIVFKHVWDPEDTGKAPPELFGQALKYSEKLVEHGIPPFFALHVWLFRGNPDGIFADYNPEVVCR
jgi:hypothetical protein